MLSPRQCAKFHQEGFLILEPFLDDRRLQILREEAEILLHWIPTKEILNGGCVIGKSGLTQSH